jgi:[ribosomal protein S5]-alanine N-acetyltransferase
VGLDSLQVVMTTKRLRLHTPTVAETEDIAGYLTRNWPHLSPWMPERDPSYFTPEHWERELATRADDPSQLTLLVRTKLDNALVGMVAFSAIARGPAQMANLGYNLAEKAQGNGYLTEGLPVALEYVFEQLGLHRVQANYLPRNERSGRLLRRLGFIVEGYARDYLKINGRWEDHILTSKTRSGVE